MAPNSSSFFYCPEAICVLHFCHIISLQGVFLDCSQSQTMVKLHCFLLFPVNHVVAFVLQLFLLLFLFLTMVLLSRGSCPGNC